ncbi:MAG: hypothetical protein PUE33_02530 [bacterium]|nr:hypothetical protein [Mycoplasmatota bacterium]MDD6756926.1 hypothetical protein [bacterium]MDY2908048.1 hypothetical protein [Candidatus Faecimonas sp.]
MKYMMDKINLLENKNAIIEGAEEIVKLLLKSEKLDDSEKLMTIELAVAKLNYELYHISGDSPEKNA